MRYSLKKRCSPLLLSGVSATCWFRGAWSSTSRARSLSCHLSSAQRSSSTTPLCRVTTEPRDKVRVAASAGYLGGGLLLALISCSSAAPALGISTHACGSRCSRGIWWALRALAFRAIATRADRSLPRPNLSHRRFSHSERLSSYSSGIRFHLVCYLSSRRIQPLSHGRVFSRRFFVSRMAAGPSCAGGFFAGQFSPSSARSVRAHRERARH